MKGLLLTNEELEAARHRIIEEIKKFVEIAGVKGGVVALSGGLDSALVAALAKMALKENLQALIMPEKGVSREEDLSHALSFAKEQGIKHRIIALDEVLEAVRGAYPELLDLKRGHLARANIAPRARMLFTYAVSNMEDLIVLGTGNKTELLLGYFTKYGDGGVDFLPIGDLYKTQVMHLARHISLPIYILEKAPSAGLWPGQKDEDELGENYDTIDSVLFLLKDRGLSFEDTASNLKVPLETVKRIDEMVETNLHKRKTPPIVELEPLMD